MKEATRGQYNSSKVGGGGYTCKVPLDLLAQDGVPPETGDSVSYSVEGTVQSTDADTATVKITSVNGEPVGGGDTESPAENTREPSESTADMGSRLAAGARGRSMPF